MNPNNELLQAAKWAQPAPTDSERAIIGWVSDNCGMTVAQEAELARRLESLRQPAPATDAEVEAAIRELMRTRYYQGAAYANGEDESSKRRWDCLVRAARDDLRAIIARRVAEVRAETQQELADLHAELDEVRDERNEACAERDAYRKAKQENDERFMRERNEACAELARLRAGGCARDQTTTQWCAEAVELQRENERLRAELAAKGGDHGK